MIIDRRRLKKEFKKSFKRIMNKSSHHNNFRYFLLTAIKQNSIVYNRFVTNDTYPFSFIYKTKYEDSNIYTFISSCLRKYDNWN